MDDLEVVKASREQWRITQRHGFVSWGDGFTLEDYERREAEFCKLSEFGKLRNHTAWVLVPGEEPQTLEHILSSCETFERPVFVKDPAHAEGYESKCFGVCTVYTPAQHRRKGYAQKLLTLLHEKMAESGVMSVLYSDVGDYYSRIKRENSDSSISTGWHIEHPYHVLWQVQDPHDWSLEGLDELQESDLDSICERDAELLRNEVKTGPEKTAFVMIPTKDQLDWPILRCKFYDTFRHPASRYNYPHIDDWGCQFGRPGDPDWAFAVWSYDLTQNNMTILRLRCKTPEQLHKIVLRAQQAARKQGMKTITAWNVPEQLLKGTGWQNVERKEHLPAMAWYGNGERPQWYCNENWAWL